MLQLWWIQGLIHVCSLQTMSIIKGKIPSKRFERIFGGNRNNSFLIHRLFLLPAFLEIQTPSFELYKYYSATDKTLFGFLTDFNKKEDVN